MLSQRVLNRTVLDRQFLLRRTDLPVLDVVDRLVGVQAQENNAPYLGLWCRIDGFRHDALTERLYARDLVRGSMFRGTQHMVTAVDYPWLRPLVQPVIERAWRGAFGRMMDGVELADLAAAAREALAGRTLTRPQVRDVLRERWPDRDPLALGWSVQALVPVVHPPPNGTWNKGGATPFVLADEWLGRPLEAAPPVERLFLRYLAAFGPASVADAQAFSGLTRLREPVDALRPQLRVYRDESGKELFDLPDAPLADPDLPAPVRFLPEFDNLLVAHADRTRVVSDADRPRVITGAVVRPTVLVDGTVAAIWRFTGQGAIEVEPFRKLSKVERAGVVAEGRALLAFAHPNTDKQEVVITPV